MTHNVCVCAYSIGIFPEGGSHDRTELLPLKAGVTLMALGAVDKYKVPVKIVPCGLNYFFGHKFRYHHADVFI
jgi:glycerol-3-phosphate O-acyltransferase/dihydroxyacetone phosphate acyltransferase